jgi:hypothetical protein
LFGKTVAAAVRFVDGALELARREVGCEVEERLVDAGDGKAVVADRFELATVDADVFEVAAATRRGEVDEALVVLDECVVDAGAALAQHRGSTTRQQCGDPPGSQREDGMAHGVDAAVDAMKPAGARPPCDPIIGQTEIDELPPRDHALLRRRDGNYGLFIVLYARSRPKFAHTGECGPFLLTDL